MLLKKFKKKIVAINGFEPLSPVDEAGIFPLDDIANNIYSR